MNHSWMTVCPAEDLVPDSGICALHEGEQVAIFREAITDEVYAISNFDPFSEANVLSRGIIGSIGDDLVVASPIYKQHFCLRTGVCIEDPEQKVKTYPVRISQGELQLKVG